MLILPIRDIYGAELGGFPTGAVDTDTGSFHPGVQASAPDAKQRL